MGFLVAAGCRRPPGSLRSRLSAPRGRREVGTRKTQEGSPGDRADVKPAGRFVAQNTPRGRNCTEIRGPAWATFGTACSQVRWQEPPMTTRSPWPISNESDSPPPRGRSASRRGSPKETIATIVSCGAASPEPVTVPGDAVAPVAVVAATRGQERLAELGAVVLRQGVARLHQQRMGEWLPLAVGVDEPGHVDHPVVHLPPLGPPRDVGDQPLQHLVGTRHEVAAYVDPGAAAQRLTLGVRQRAQPRGRRLEERPLEVHASDGSTRSNRCSTIPGWVRPGVVGGLVRGRPGAEPGSRGLVAVGRLGG